MHANQDGSSSWRWKRRKRRKRSLMWSKKVVVDSLSRQGTTEEDEAPKTFGRRRRSDLHEAKGERFERRISLQCSSIILYSFLLRDRTRTWEQRNDGEVAALTRLVASIRAHITTGVEEKKIDTRKDLLEWTKRTTLRNLVANVRTSIELFSVSELSLSLSLFPPSLSLSLVISTSGNRYCSNSN